MQISLSFSRRSALKSFQSLSNNSQRYIDQFRIFVILSSFFIVFSFSKEFRFQLHCICSFACRPKLEISKYKFNPSLAERQRKRKGESERKQRDRERERERERERQWWIVLMVADTT